PRGAGLPRRPAPPAGGARVARVIPTRIGDLRHAGAHHGSKVCVRRGARAERDDPCDALTHLVRARAAYPTKKADEPHEDDPACAHAELRSTRRTNACTTREQRAIRTACVAYASSRRSSAARRASLLPSS